MTKQQALEPTKVVDEPTNETQEAVETTDTGEIQTDEAMETHSPDVETEARAMGWRPLEDWVAGGGDPNNWKGAGAFVNDKQLFEAISQSKKQIKRLEAELSKVRNRTEKAARAEVEQYKQMLLDAEETGDLDSYKKAQTKLNDLESDFIDNSEQLDAIKQFEQENKEWLDKVDRSPLAVKIQTRAAEIGEQVNFAKSDLPLMERMKLAQQLLHKEFPLLVPDPTAPEATEKTSKTRPVAAVSMTNPTKTGAKAAKNYVSMLTPSQKALFQQHIQMRPDSNMTIDEYAAKLYGAK